MNHLLIAIAVSAVLLVGGFFAGCRLPLFVAHEYRTKVMFWVWGIALVITSVIVPAILSNHS